MLCSIRNCHAVFRNQFPLFVCPISHRQHSDNVSFFFPSLFFLSIFMQYNVMSACRSFCFENCFVFLLLLLLSFATFEMICNKSVCCCPLATPHWQITCCSFCSFCWFGLVAGHCHCHCRCHCHSPCHRHVISLSLSLFIYFFCCLHLFAFIFYTHAERFEG